MNSNKEEFICRIKSYENNFKQKLYKGEPAILRLKLENYKEVIESARSFGGNEIIKKDIIRSIIDFSKDINNIQFGYFHHSEVSFLLNDYKKDFEYFLGGDIQRMISYYSSKLSSHLRNYINTNCIFTGKIFSINKHDIINYFILQQRNCEDIDNTYGNIILKNLVEVPVIFKEINSLPIEIPDKIDRPRWYFKKLNEKIENNKIIIQELI